MTEDKMARHSGIDETKRAPSAVALSHGRLKALDGWRAISILAVMAAHMLPLGPARWGLNASIAANGMAIFFALSGFLITRMLQGPLGVGAFLIRRLARILPLAWTALILSFSFQRPSLATWLANIFFYANLPPFRLTPSTSHYWSLGVEMQFYIIIALVVLLIGRRGLVLVPVAALMVTGFRIATGTEISIVTWFRVDEILAGGALSLFVTRVPSRYALNSLKHVPFWPTLMLFLLSTRPEVSWLNYARPYITVTMIGITIARPVRLISPILESKTASYIARISYALYIIHHFTLFGWLGSGKTTVKYLKRPLCISITFLASHISTFYFENHFTRWAHAITSRASAKRTKMI